MGRGQQKASARGDAVDMSMTRHARSESRPRRARQTALIYGSGSRHCN